MTNQPEMRLEILGEMYGHRRVLVRMVLMYSLISAGAGALTLASLDAVLGGSYGALIPLSILLLITSAAVFQLITAVLDLRAEPTFTRGAVTRLWTKGGLFWFFRSHYLSVKRQIFVLTPEVWVGLEEDNIVELHHWPHTRTLIRAVLISGETSGLVEGEPVSPLTEVRRDTPAT